MRNSTWHLQYLALILGFGAAGLFAACGDSGGSSGTGGAKSTGGAKGTGGAVSTGGSKATGGSTGSGGTTSGSGGTAGAGGIIATGGTKASGGTTGGGATGTIDGGPGIDGGESIDGGPGIDGNEGIDAPESEAGAGPTTLFDFATGVQGWVLNTYQATNGDGTPKAPFNLAKDGIQLDGGTMPTIGFDGTVGDPAGSLVVTVDFTDYSQEVMPNIVYATPVDWTGKTITLRVKVDATLPADLQYSGFSIYAQDTSYALSKQLVVNFPTNTDWHTLTLPIAANGNSFDATKVGSFVVSIYSNEPPTGLDGAAPGVTPTSVTVHIDTIQLQ